MRNSSSQDNRLIISDALFYSRTFRDNPEQLDEICKAYYRWLKMDTCTWSEDADSVWTSDCGQDFELVWGTPTENEFTYCCFCGKKLVEKQYSEKNEE